MSTNESKLLEFLGKYDTYIFSLNGEQKYLGFGLDEDKKIRLNRYESMEVDRCLHLLIPSEYCYNITNKQQISQRLFPNHILRRRGNACFEIYPTNYKVEFEHNKVTLTFAHDTITIACYNDDSRIVNENEYKGESMDIDDLFTLDTVDYDQSSFTNNKMYVVLDIFKVGKFNKEQVDSYNGNIEDKLGNKHYYKTSFAMMICYDFETGESYEGLWDYIHKCPLVMHRVWDKGIHGMDGIKKICDDLAKDCNISQKNINIL